MYNLSPWAHIQELMCSGRPQLELLGSGTYSSSVVTDIAKYFIKWSGIKLLKLLYFTSYCKLTLVLSIECFLASRYLVLLCIRVFPKLFHTVLIDLFFSLDYLLF